MNAIENLQRISKLKPTHGSFNITFKSKKFAEAKYGDPKALFNPMVSLINMLHVNIASG